MNTSDHIIPLWKMKQFSDKSTQRTGTVNYWTFGQKRTSAVFWKAAEYYSLFPDSHQSLTWKDEGAWLHHNSNGESDQIYSLSGVPLSLNTTLNLPLALTHRSIQLLLLPLTQSSGELIGAKPHFLGLVIFCSLNQFQNRPCAERHWHEVGHDACWKVWPKAAFFQFNAKQMESEVWSLGLSTRVLLGSIQLTCQQ